MRENESNLTATQTALAYLAQQAQQLETAAVDFELGGAGKAA